METYAMPTLLSKLFSYSDGFGARKNHDEFAWLLLEIVQYICDMTPRRSGT